MAAELRIGSRISFGGDLCTVRYIGPVQGTKGDWLGIEWDDPTRGKHDGRAGGVRYFSCLSKAPTSGSFVRANRPADKRRTFLEALRFKYADDGETSSRGDEFYGLEPAYIVGKRQPEKAIRISGKEAEEVGFDKIRKQQSKLDELRIVLLDGLCVSESRAVDSVEEISKTCPSVKELDLSRNLFELFSEVAVVIHQLQQLRELRIDGNRFRSIEWPHSIAPNIPSIQRLMLENTLLTWEQILSVASNFHDLTFLSARDNELTQILMKPSSTLASSLTTLNLEGNEFTKLSELRHISTFSKLQRLILSHNKISTISSLDEGESLKFPDSLASVDFAYNEINSWDVINRLKSIFPGIVTLRISHNPLYNDLQAPGGRQLGPDDGYMLTIARIASLETLNYSPIVPKDRLNAETYYLSLIAQELALAPEDQESIILAQHPRYKELCDEFGEPEIRRSVDKINPNSLAALLVKVKFHVGPGTIPKLPSSSTPTSFDLELPKRLNIYSVLGIVGKRLGIMPYKLKLFWETGDWEFKRVGHVENDEEWDSENEDEEGAETEGKVMREVEMVAGTRSLGNWIEGSEVTMRVEFDWTPANTVR